jgi:transposase InsO family protein
MRRQGLHALQPKAFTPRTTDSTHGLRCAPNRLLDQPKPTQANRVWVSDITYLPLASGDWAYLRAFQDMGTKHVVGWHVGATMPEEFVTTALQRAFFSQPPTPGLLVLSDRGGQHCGNAYRILLYQHGALRSQSRGDCYDNAQAESLWSRRKTEVLEGREWPVFAALAEAQASVAVLFWLLQSRTPAFQYWLSDALLHSSTTASKYCPKLFSRNGPPHATITPTPNRFGAVSKPSCWTAATSPVWLKPSSKSATTSPTTMPGDATQRWATVPPTTSKPIFKQRPNSVRLS